MADLDIINASLADSTLAQGATITARWSVKNEGTRAIAATTVSIEIWNKATRAFVTNPATGRSIFATESTRALDPGETDSSESESFALPANLAPGDYELVLTALTPTGTDSNLNNNAQRLAFSVRAAVADLDIINASLADTSLAPGETITANWQVENDGNAAIAATTISIRIKTAAGTVVNAPNGNPVWAFEDTRALAPGEVDTGESVSFTLPTNLAPGNYDLEIGALTSAGLDADLDNNFQLLRFSVVGDEVREGTSTTATLAVGGTVQGRIDQNGINGANLSIDKDWYRVELLAGRTYSFSGTAGVSSSDTLDALAIVLYNSGGTAITTITAATDNATPGFSFTASASGTHYLAVSAGGSGAWQDKTGEYRVSLADTTPATVVDKVREGTSTTEALAVGSTVQGRIDQNGINGANLSIDRDWYRVELVAGRTYSFSGTAGVSSSDTLDALAIRLYNSSGTAITSITAATDNATPGFTFTAGTSGTHYLAVSAGGSGTWQDKTGEYRVSLAETTAPVVTDTVREGTGTDERLAVGGSVDGSIDQNGLNGFNTAIDKDWYRVELVAGRTYSFNGTANVSTSDSLNALAIRLYNQDGVSQTDLSDSPTPNLTFTAKTSGIYFLAVSAGGSGAWQDKTGAFRISLADSTATTATDNVPYGTGTTVDLNIGQRLGGRIDQNGRNGPDPAIDSDWYRVDLVAGRTYSFSGSANVDPNDTLNGLTLELFNSAGLRVRPLAEGAAPSLTYRATDSGPHYLAVAAGGAGARQDKTGLFEISVTETPADSTLQSLLKIYEQNEDYIGILDDLLEAAVLTLKALSHDEYARIATQSGKYFAIIYDKASGEYHELLLKDSIISAINASGGSEYDLYLKFAKKASILGGVTTALEFGFSSFDLIRGSDTVPQKLGGLADKLAGLAAGALTAKIGLAILTPVVLASPPGLVTIAVAVTGSALIMGAGEFVSGAVEEAGAFRGIIDGFMEQGYVPYDDPSYAPFLTANSTPIAVNIARESSETHTLTEQAPIVWGLPKNLFNDHLINFTNSNSLVMPNSTIPRLDLDINSGSAIIRIRDQDANTLSDPITLQGDFSNGEFMTVAANNSTILRFVEFAANLRTGAAVANERILGLQNPDFFLGNGVRAFSIRAVAHPNAPGDASDAFGTFWIDAAGRISNVRLFQASDTGLFAASETLGIVPSGVMLGVFLVDGGAALAASIKATDQLSLMPHSDPGQGGLWLEINGIRQDLPIFNSVSRALNPDGLNHIVSGAMNGGGGMIIGFEDGIDDAQSDFVDLIVEIVEKDAGAKYDLAVGAGGTSIDTFVPGQSSSWLISAHNAGRTEFKGSVRFVTFLSKDGMFSADDIIVSDFVVDGATILPGNNSKTVTYGYTIPAGTPAGEYRLGTIIVDDGDANQANNLSWIGNNRDGDLFTILDRPASTAKSDISIANSTVDWIITASNAGSILRGNDLNNIMNGSAGADSIVGGAGNDIITGAGGDDVFWGESGADILAGDAGGDAFVGGPDNDIIDGGAGFDWAFFTGQRLDYQISRSGSKIIVRDMRTQGDGTDELASIEFLVFADTALAFRSFEVPGLPRLANFTPGAGGWTSQDQFPRAVADVNGDGFADIIGFGRAGTLVALGSAVGTFAAPVLALANFGVDQGWSSANSVHRELADVNSDGRADIVGFGTAGVLVSLAQANGTFAAPALGSGNFNPANGWSSHDGFARTMADVNGDGFADIVGFGIPGTFVALGDGRGGFGNPVLALADFGKNQGWTSNNQFHREVGDVNGDGRADIVGFGTAGTLVALGQANGSFTAAGFALGNFGANQGWTSQDVFARDLADVNGDGRDDIVGFGQAGTFVAHGQGDGSFSAAAFDLANFGRNQGWTSDNVFHRVLADLNGDGRADIIGFGATGVFAAFAFDGQVL